MSEKIDFVVTWVDGSDPVWQAKRRECMPENKRNFDTSEVRFRDWGLLPYVLRSIEKYAPWAGNIYLVTAGQVPDYISTDNPRLKVVFHEDFMAPEYLPTFSSSAIEFNLHKIPGLSEQFVYLNDDVILTAMTKEEDFFKDGLPLDMHIQNVIAPINEIVQQAAMNNMKIVNKNCSKRDFMKNNPSKWFNLKYGPNMLRNLLLKKWDYYTGFYDPHAQLTLTKKMLADLWKTEFKAMHSACSHKFKSSEDVNIWLCRYLYLAKGEFIPRKASFSRYTQLSDDNEQIFNYIKKRKQKIICVNDTSRCTDFEGQKIKLTEAFEYILPEKSSFEKDV